MKVRSSSARNSGLHISVLALAIASSSQLMAAEPATEYVEVVGQAVSIDKALKEQRSSDNVESVVHADGIGQLPDDNAAEALQRIPGLSVERDQGEGRFVSVRGIGPDLNSVTINGTLVPSPESDRRAVALDVLPDRKSTRLNSSHSSISYAFFCFLKTSPPATYLSLPPTCYYLFNLLHTTHPF